MSSARFVMMSCILMVASGVLLVSCCLVDSRLNVFVVCLLVLIADRRKIKMWNNGHIRWWINVMCRDMEKGVLLVVHELCRRFGFVWNMEESCFEVSRWCYVMEFEQHKNLRAQRTRYEYFKMHAAMVRIDTWDTRVWQTKINIFWLLVTIRFDSSHINNSNSKSSS